MPLRRRLGFVLGLAGLAFILVATLTPAVDPEDLAAATPLLCLVCGDQGGADVVLNLLLFLPLAVGLRLSGESWKRTVFASFLISFNVELLQYWLVAGRDTSLSDLLTNTASGAIGATIGTHLPRWSFPAPGRAMGLALAWLGTVLLILATWGWLLQPGVPDGRLISDWARQVPGEEILQVRSVDLDGVAMPPAGSPPDAVAVRQRLSRGMFSLDAEVISGRPFSKRYWVYTLRVPPGEVLTLHQWRRQAGAAIPVRGLRYRLHHPTIALRDGFPDSAGALVHLHVSESSGQILLSSQYRGVERSMVLGLSPAFGWTLFAPFELVAGLSVRWVTAAVLAMMLLPLGYWAAWWRPRWRSLALVAPGLMLVLAGVPAVAGFPPVHWSEWLAGATGALVGWALQRSAAKLAKRGAAIPAAA